MQVTYRDLQDGKYEVGSIFTNLNGKNFIFRGVHPKTKNVYFMYLDNYESFGKDTYFLNNSWVLSPYDAELRPELTREHLIPVETVDQEDLWE